MKKTLGLRVKQPAPFIGGQFASSIQVKASSI